MWEIPLPPAGISTGNNTTLFVPAPSPLSYTLHCTMRIWRDSTLTLFQVQINFAVFPDSKLDSGKNKVFHILAVVLSPREKYTPWHQALSQDVWFYTLQINRRCSYHPSLITIIQKSGSIRRLLTFSNTIDIDFHLPSNLHVELWFFSSYFPTYEYIIHRHLSLGTTLLSKLLEIFSMVCTQIAIVIIITTLMIVASSMTTR